MGGCKPPWWDPSCWLLLLLLQKSEELLLLLLQESEDLLLLWKEQLLLLRAPWLGPRLLHTAEVLCAPELLLLLLPRKPSQRQLPRGSRLLLVL